MAERPILSLPGSGPNAFDRLVSWVSPGAGVRRLRARAQLSLASGHIAYTGARRDRPATKAWNPPEASADEDVLPSLPALRGRSRDLARNAPLATGALGTHVTHTIGPGLKLKATVDRDALGLTKEEADAWERRAERIFRTVARTTQLDFERRRTFGVLGLAGAYLKAMGD